MKTIEEVLKEIKENYEKTIRTATFNGERKVNGLEAKKCLIRSSRVINMLHEHIKEDLVMRGVPEKNLAPQLKKTGGELKMQGKNKAKRQDICVKPIGIMPKREPLKKTSSSSKDGYDRHGQEYGNRILTINVRSQFSSTKKNFDTLMERTFAESFNLHSHFPHLVMGEVYVILAQEYDEQAMKDNEVVFKEKQDYIETYIEEFYNLNNRKDHTGENDRYERCALLIVDMNREIPKIYRTTQELRDDELISESFDLSIESLLYDTFLDDLLKIYDSRFGLHYLLEEKKEER